MNTCKNCTFIIKSNSSSLQCDASRGFIHSTCAGISENYAMITRAKARCIEVVCNNCNSNMAQFGVFKTLIASLKTDFASALEALKNESPKVDCIMEEIIDEMNERQIRKKKIILFGVLEQSDDLDDAAQQANWKIFRLRKQLSAQVRPRPIKAIMDNEEISYAAIRKAKTLKNISKYKNAFISSDKTPMQIRLYNDAKAEVRTRVANGEKNLKIKKKVHTCCLRNHLVKLKEPKCSPEITCYYQKVRGLNT
ncbi:hypothetical protein QE152_g31945 [Popillia japonica]|uniref:Zinc finger PHD-type domain-containing protein n=1 Tax=Popillia japonica TaxID=7064 RepID=A0AAW1J0I6_POPJA